MKILTLSQPLASLLVWNHLKYVTKSWATSYRGDVLIYAGEVQMNEAKSDLWIHSFEIDPSECNISYDYVVGVAKLVNCYPITQKRFTVPSVSICPNSVSPQERLAGGWKLGRFAWRFENPQLIIGLNIRAKQGFVDAPVDVAAEVKRLRGHSDKTIDFSWDDDFEDEEPERYDYYLEDFDDDLDTA